MTDTNININYNPIFRVKYLVNNETDKILVFYGKNIDNLTQQELLSKVFTDEELDYIEENSINVVFLEEQIHFDDTIGTIKLKILEYFKEIAGFEEIYLFYQKKEILNAVEVYQSLTQNKKIQLTKLRLEQFLSNVVNKDEKFNLDLDKEVYDYDDILSMNFNNKEYIIEKVLGQKFFIVENEYPFICDPYKATRYDSFFERNLRRSLTTLNSHLLLNSGKIINNDIYLCLARDVLFYNQQNEMDQKTTIKIYYPFLFSKNIFSLENLETNSAVLIEGNKKLLNAKSRDYFRTIDMFYGVFNYREPTKELKYLSKGIKYIRAIIKPSFTVKIPLETIFKIVHASESNPLIKYNPSSRQENVYRLYADKISTDGRKIPYLKKAIIFKLMKTIGKGKSVTIYIENIDKNLNSLICEFDENGYITITSEFNNVVSEMEIDLYFREMINPVIEEMKSFLEQSGYKISTFNSLYDENIEVKQMTYECQIELKSKFVLEKYKGCLSSIFVNESSEFKSGISLRFKRVANFNKVTSQEAFILEKQEQGYRGMEIVDALLENFPDDLTRDDALQLVRKIANEIQVERGVRKSEIKIKDNPGFKTQITINEKTNIITIKVENINDINYLSTIPVYLDTMVRLTQNKTSTKFPSTRFPIKDVNRVCSSGEKEEVKISDIISSTELSNEDQTNDEVKELVVFADEDVTNEVELNDENPNKAENALDLFFGDDEDEEEDEDDEGKGLSSDDDDNDSGSSIDSEPDDFNLTKSKSIVVPKVKSSSGSSITSEIDESLKSFGTDDSLETVEDIIVPEPLSEIINMNPVINPVLSPITEIIEELAMKKPAPIKKPAPPKKTLKIEEESDEELEEEEEEQEESEEEEEEEKGLERNIDNMSLKKKEPYFQTKIEKLDPVLILKEDTKEFNSYSRVCSSTTRRQPVILTDEELEKINTENKGFLREEDVIKYGSDPKKQYNYICPRYWCLKNDTIVNPSDLKEVIGKDGKKELVHPTCGKVLPKGATKVTPGYYIYEFYQPKPGKKGYKRFPGFQTDKHPDGFCLPCCFDKYNTVGRVQAKEMCSSKKDETTVKGKKSATAVAENDNYVMGPEKFPLSAGRWGYLPVQIQKILNEVNADCQISKTNTNIKPNHPCLVRHGVELNEKQSFIACISDALFFANGTDSKILSIKDMKKRIIRSLTIDNFIQFQNGNLVTIFYNPDINASININSPNYTNTVFYKKINLDSEPDKQLLIKTISAFENYIAFLSDDTVVIDHTYLWDIVSTPNKYIFGNVGINLIIFEIPNDDITSNVQIVCPTNHYSTEFYDPRKPTLFLLKEDNYYEPIYSYTIRNNKISIGKVFSEQDPVLIKPIKMLIENIIKPYFDTVCKPMESMPDIYLAKRPPLLLELATKLYELGYKFDKLVMNFNNKIIGVVATSPDNKSGFVPCYPSSLNFVKKPVESLKNVSHKIVVQNLLLDTEYVLMNDLSIWRPYNETVEYLLDLKKRSKRYEKTIGIIPCKPEFKIIEDEMVVGILTETNQFIQISETIMEEDIRADLNIRSLRNENYIVDKTQTPLVSADVQITTSQDVDQERVEYIKKIKMESNFYNIFRNTIRILLNDYENVSIREEIESELSKPYSIYTQKLQKIVRALIKLVNGAVQFIGKENYYKLIQEVSTCIVKNENSCLKAPNLCAISENGKCKLIIPQRNLITNKENEKVYYNRMADELIRYSRIKSFMFQPQFFLSFGKINYNLRENEIIMVQSSLTQEYFENLIAASTNSYVKNNSYDVVEPLIKQTYDNTIIPSQIVPPLKPLSVQNEGLVAPILEPSLEPIPEPIPEPKPNIVLECTPTTNPKISSGEWGKCFPKKFTELEYNKTSSCTFSFMSDLIEKHTGRRIEINEIKNNLIEEYSKYLPNYSKKIIDILAIEGKKKPKNVTFQDFIYNIDYFLTTFDLWLLVNKYRIPTIFLFKTKGNLFMGYGFEGDNFAFVIIPGLGDKVIPGYKVIQEEKKNIFISLDVITDDECYSKMEHIIQNARNIEDYLMTFTKKTKLIIEEDVVPQEKQLLKMPVPVEKEPFVVEAEAETEAQAVAVVEPIKLNVKKPKTLKSKRAYVSRQQTKKNNIVIESDTPPMP